MYYLVVLWLSVPVQSIARTRPRNDLLCVEWMLNSTHSSLFIVVEALVLCVHYPLMKYVTCFEPLFIMECIELTDCVV